MTDVFPDLAESIRRVQEQDAVSRERVSLHLHLDVIAKFRTTGEGWDALIDQVLKSAKI